MLHFHVLLQLRYRRFGVVAIAAGQQTLVLHVIRNQMTKKVLSIIQPLIAFLALYLKN